jgi:hypothetical protein
MRQPTIHQMREKKKSSRKSQGSRKVTILKKGTKNKTQVLVTFIFY